MTSAGGFYRASVRRQLALPPAWLGRPSAAPPLFPLPDHRSLAELEPAPAAAPPVERAAEPAPPVFPLPDHRRLAELEPAPVAAPPVERAAEPVPARRIKAPLIDLASATSTMEARAQRAAEQARREARIQQEEQRKPGLVPCRCGSRSSGAGAGLVPDWFGRDCIEAACPLKDQAE